MASFVEQAILQVKDQSTPQIKKINQALRQLQSTAKSLKSMKVDLGMNTGKLKTASAEVRKLSTDLRALRSASSGVRISVNTSGISQAQRQIAQLRTSTSRPITITTRAGQMARTPLHYGGGIPGAAVRGFAGGAGAGLPILAGINPAFAAVTSAAYLAAKGLSAVADATTARSRSQLGLQVAATPEQVAIINEQAKRPGKMPLNVSEDTFRDLARSLLGDVGGDTPAEKATSASNLARTLLRDVLPVSYALAPAGTTLEQAGQGLAAAAKAINIASSDFTDASGNLTAEGKRAFEGVMLGKYIAPEVPFEQIRTLLANLKSSATSFSSEAIARVIAESADLRQRAGNEIYQMVESFSGTLDNKRLNNALAAAGLLLDVRRNKRGNVVGGTAKDAALLESDPTIWWGLHGKEFVKGQVQADKQVQKAGEKRVAALLKDKPTATQEAIEAARAPTQSETNAVLRTLFPSMRATARNAMTRLMFGGGQWQRQLEQGKSVVGQDLQKIFDENLIAQLENVRTTLGGVASNFGESAQNALGLTKILKDIDDAIKDPRGDAAKRLTQQGIELAQFTNPMTVAGKLLTKAGEMLIKGVSRWFGDTEEPKSAAQQAAEDISKAQTDRAVIQNRRNIEMANQRYIDLQKQRDRQQKIIDDPQSGERQRQVAQRELTRINLQLAPLQKVVDGLTAQLTSLAVKLGSVELPDWAKTPPEPLVKPPPEGDKKWGDLKPSSMDDIITAAQNVKDSTATWVNSIVQGPSAFEQTFSTLPPRAGEAGTNLGTTAISTIKGGAGDAGAAFGNSALSIIRGGLANIPITVNAKVVGGEAKADTGGTKPD